MNLPDGSAAASDALKNGIHPTTVAVSDARLLRYKPIDRCGLQPPSIAGGQDMADIVRRLETVVEERLRSAPVVVLHGARTVGKSTLLRRVAAAHGQQVADLDHLQTRQAATEAPSFFVQGSAPVFIDEFQHVPELLDAIKAELNAGLSPGRFVLAGSTNYLTMPRAAQSLTGRADVLTVWPLSQAELSGGPGRFVETLIASPESLMDRSPSGTTRIDYMRRVLRGGLPVPSMEDREAARNRWYANYLDLVVQRDVLDIRRIRQRAAMPLLLTRLVSQTGQLLNMARAAQEAGLERSVGEDYTRLLEAVFMVHRLPAWGITLGARVNSMPKVHVVDTGLGGWLLGVRERGLERREPTTLQQFGHLLETFAVNEILKQVSWLDDPVRIGHFRTKDGIEVDLVIEVPGEGVIGIEVKSGERAGSPDVRGLAALRDRLGPRFRTGVLLHPGQRSSPLGDRLFSTPIDRLWSV